MQEQQWGRRWRRIAEKTEISKDISQVSRPSWFIVNRRIYAFVLFWHRVKYSCLMNIANATSRISKITLNFWRLNYFAFLPAKLILNSDDFALFYLPACLPSRCWTYYCELFYHPTCYPDAELRWFWTILPSCLPSRCWTQMILNYFTFLPAIQVLN